MSTLDLYRSGIQHHVPSLAPFEVLAQKLRYGPEEDSEQFPEELEHDWYELINATGERIKELTQPHDEPTLEKSLCKYEPMIFSVVDALSDIATRSCPAYCRDAAICSLNELG